jgi:murein DD-endopeptidase MepM/ murein hydrolase activator NlpD
VSLGPRNQAKQVIGIGGPEDTRLQNLVKMGEKKQEEEIKEMHEELSRMTAAASNQETSLQLLIEHFEDKRSLYASTPSVWPLRGWVTSSFGRRISPFSGIPAFHEGMDIAARVGTPVLAPADGVVVKAAFSPGYGNMVEIWHGYGIRTIYGHNSRLNVKEGQHVKRGDVISYTGDTGSSTGPHLHYEVRLNGLPVNPVKYLN